MAEKHTIFISYSRADRAFKDRLRDDLEAAGVEVWTDERIQLGEDWQRRVTQAIADCRGVVALVSPNAGRSEWVQQDIDTAEALHKPIYPLLISGGSGELSPLRKTLLEKYAALDARAEHYEAALKQLVDISLEPLKQA
jgi:hypothetical protein